ncbi:MULTISPECIES: class I SAM-dependent DNA methyltransferase [Halocynthiibacter]|uniref:Class I SAM-dependent methyltransferase n=1 Tax=Halocynthiibacter halioticoli TaxID=2986804 RepID=A0AAE3IW29_9RHOB|nr:MULTISPECIES: class I SAM-dependent methyltransferase [Halocynthiibacter]MCV6823252.1 class I SAM-dependent methyltransferase [Halocynthiibacter halioticoli]MCW4056253.1 class I SAM-dependent methyltransferase [Halocynthiibacter sp. SDUM655004]
MSIDPETVSAYNERARDYTKLAAPNAPYHALNEFIALVPKGGRVLDFGCGPARTAAAMRDAGLVVDAMDASQSMVDLAKKSYNIDVTLGSFDDLDKVDLYDGIWASFSLLHAPKAELPRHLAAIKTAIKAGGIFHISMKTGTGEQRDKIGRFYAYYSKEELVDLLKAAGFRPNHFATGADKGLDGTVAPWIMIRAYA